MDEQTTNNPNLYGFNSSPVHNSNPTSSPFCTRNPILASQNFRSRHLYQSTDSAKNDLKDHEHKHNPSYLTLSPQTYGTSSRTRSYSTQTLTGTITPRRGSFSRGDSTKDDLNDDEPKHNLLYSPTLSLQTYAASSRKGSYSTQTSTGTITPRRGSFSRRDSSCSLPCSMYATDSLSNWKEYQPTNDVYLLSKAFDNLITEGHSGRKITLDITRKDSSSSGYNTDRKDSFQDYERQQSLLSPQSSLDLGWRNESFPSSPLCTNPSSPFFNSSGSQYRVADQFCPQPYRSRRNSYSSLPSSHLPYPSAFLPNPSLPPLSPTMFGSHLSLNSPSQRHRELIS